MASHSQRQRIRIIESPNHDFLLLDRGDSGDYLLLEWDEKNHPQQQQVDTSTTAPIATEATGIPIQTNIIPGEGIYRARQPPPKHYTSTHHLHSKNNFTPRPQPPLPLPASDSESITRFYDLRAIHNSSPRIGSDALDYVPQEIIELHIKKSKEKNGVNPEELPEVWKAPPPPEENNQDTANGNGDTNEDDDEVELVQRAPDSNPNDDISDSCRTIRGKYGERSSKNPGIILRYQYELIQDLSNIDYSMNSRGERDGTEYLVENVVPALEQGVGDLLVRTLFEECGGRRIRRRMRGGRRLKSTVVGLDGEPDDFPLEQGECISEYTPTNPLLPYQCHVMEGSVTLYFPPNYSYPTQLTAANLQILRAIKEGMENDELLTSHENILSLLFLDKSYGLEPVYPGQEVGVLDPTKGNTPSNSNGGKSNTGLIVGMVFLILIILALTSGGLYYKKTRDEELAREEERRRAMEELNAKIRSSSFHSGSSRSGNRSGNHRRREAMESEEEEEGSTTTDDDGSTTDDGTTTSGDDGTTTSGDDGTTTSDDDSTTSSSKNTTTDSSDSESESEMAYLAFGKKKKQPPRAKRVKSNIVYSGGDEASVMTGATGFHSVSSQRTVKAKNVNIPGGVNINMR